MKPSEYRSDFIALVKRLLVTIQVHTYNYNTGNFQRGGTTTSSQEEGGDPRLLKSNHADDFSHSCT